ncbi:MAG: hypothetical protein JWP91_1715 [Fibrobacteres bacterium]|nr:hypothetical protein [Fibrobacterota bacterium]
MDEYAWSCRIIRFQVENEGGIRRNWKSEGYCETRIPGIGPTDAPTAPCATRRNEATSRWTYESEEASSSQRELGSDEPAVTIK